MDEFMSEEKANNKIFIDRFSKINDEKTNNEQVKYFKYFFTEIEPKKITYEDIKYFEDFVGYFTKIEPKKITYEDIKCFEDLYLYVFNCHLLKYESIINLYEFKKLSTNDKYKFLISKNILIKKGKTEFSITCVSDRVPIVYKKEPFHFSNHTEIDGYSYKINKALIEEFYNYIRVQAEGFPPSSIETIKQRTKHLSSKKQIKKLKKIKTNQIKIFNKNSSYHEEGYYNEKSTNNKYSFESWISLIKYLGENDLFYYLTGNSKEVENARIFSLWSELYEADEIIKYCKKEIQRLNEASNTSKLEPKNSNTTKNIETENPLNSKYSSNLFDKPEKEELFNNILFRCGVINTDNSFNLKKSQPYFDAIWKVHYENSVKEYENYKDPRKKIFKSMLASPSYAALLREEYGLKVNQDNKLASGTNYMGEVSEYIDEFYKNKERE